MKVKRQDNDNNEDNERHDKLFSNAFLTFIFRYFFFIILSTSVFQKPPQAIHTYTHRLTVPLETLENPLQRHLNCLPKPLTREIEFINFQARFGIEIIVVFFSIFDFFCIIFVFFVYVFFGNYFTKCFFINSEYFIFIYF